VQAPHLEKKKQNKTNNGKELNQFSCPFFHFKNKSRKKTSLPLKIKAQSDIATQE
jgi:hypothetical protein